MRGANTRERRRPPILIVMFLHLESRVAKALLQLVESVGLRALHSPSVELHVSQRELGNMAGGSRESVNKIF
jgi:CRP-like cAMP-binding protein